MRTLSELLADISKLQNQAIAESMKPRSDWKKVQRILDRIEELDNQVSAILDTGEAVA